METLDFGQAADNALVMGSIGGWFILFTCGFLVVHFAGRQ